jgi:RimJ/RimL family protein N-acetyltransferase
MSASDLPMLQGPRVTLRRPSPQDIAARLRLGIDPEVHRMYGGSRDELRPVTEETATRWVERLLDHDYGWVIEVEVLIGQIRLDRVDLRDKRASLALGIEDRARLGIGLGTEAIGLVLDYAFSVLGLHRVSARVVEYNARAIRAYEKCGFVREGREREAAWVDGAWHDDIMMGVLDRDCAARKTDRP